MLYTEFGMSRKQIVKYSLYSLGVIFIQTVFIHLGHASEDKKEPPQLINQCKTCHGIDGIAKIPIAPNITGEPVNYLIAQLTAFKTGKREHEMMSVVTQTLDDVNIALISHWFAEQKFSTSTSTDNPPQAVIENCVECHGKDGIGSSEDIPHLAGESTIYLETQLKAFRSGRRDHETMSKIAAELSDEQIRQIAQWYEQIKISVGE